MRATWRPSSPRAPCARRSRWPTDNSPRTLRASSRARPSTCRSSTAARPTSHCSRGSPRTWRRTSSRPRAAAWSTGPSTSSTRTPSFPKPSRASSTPCPSTSTSRSTPPASTSTATARTGNRSTTTHTRSAAGRKGRTSPWARPSAANASSRSCTNRPVRSFRFRNATETSSRSPRR